MFFPDKISPDSAVGAQRLLFLS